MDSDSFTYGYFRFHSMWNRQQDYWLFIPHCPKGLDVDTEEPSPCVPFHKTRAVCG